MDFDLVSDGPRHPKFLAGLQQKLSTVPGLSADKGKVIKQDMLEDEIEFNEALFSDDSTGNIKSAKDVCNTLLLPKRLGLDGTDCAYMEALVSKNSGTIPHPKITILITAVLIAFQVKKAFSESNA